jgi:hypothetical protein
MAPHALPGLSRRASAVWTILSGVRGPAQSRRRRNDDCRDIAQAFEEQLTYPGEIKVTVLRESRFTEMAR